MALTTRKKLNEIKKTRRHAEDTGSPESQIAILTRRINELSTHLKRNQRDKHSRKGLLGLVEKRRKQINYLIDTNPDAYNKVAKELDLKTLAERRPEPEETEEE
ncbi:MAG: 30S ribosomal protein S15 [Candidatus Paceibacterota bacterium]